MNVAYVVERFPQRSQTFIQNELRSLHLLGVQPRVFALYPPRDPDPTSADLDSVTLPSLASRPWRLGLALVRLLVAAPSGLVAAVAFAARRPSRFQLHTLVKGLVLADLLRRDPPERIHAHFARGSASAALIASRVWGSRFSFTAHAIDVFVEPFDVDRKLDAADVTITVCDYNKRFLETHWPGRGHIAVVPCGVDPDALTRTTPYRRDPFQIVTIGRLVEKKGFDVLLEACAALLDRNVAFHCTIVGDGPEHERLAGLIDELGLGDVVSLPGAVLPTEVGAVLESASVFALPCVVAADGDRDSQPVVIKEAMAMEIPVIATREVGIPEIVDEQVGALVPPRDAASLARAFAVFADTDETVLVEMGARGRDRVRLGLTANHQGAGLLEAWERVSSGGRG